MTQEHAEAHIPILTEVIPEIGPPHDRELLVAEIQTELAARTFALTEALLHSAFAELEAIVLERISARLRSEIPEIIDATLRAHLPTDDDQGP